jgi:hypothetical protein
LAVNNEGDLISLLSGGDNAGDIALLTTEQIGGDSLTAAIDFGQGRDIDLAAFTFDATTEEITLNASPETTGTHLSASLKDLQKLGVDAVSIAGMDNVSIELGAGGFQFNADGSVSALPNFESDNGQDINVTLDVNGLTQVFDAADLATATNLTSKLWVSTTSASTWSTTAASCKASLMPKTLQA